MGVYVAVWMLRRVLSVLLRYLVVVFLVLALRAIVIAMVSCLEIIM